MSEPARATTLDWSGLFALIESVRNAAGGLPTMVMRQPIDREVERLTGLRITDDIQLHGLLTALGTQARLLTERASGMSGEILGCTESDYLEISQAVDLCYDKLVILLGDYLPLRTSIEPSFRQVITLPRPGPRQVAWARFHISSADQARLEQYEAAVAARLTDSEQLLRARRLNTRGAMAQFDPMGLYYTLSSIWLIDFYLQVELRLMQAKIDSETVAKLSAVTRAAAAGCIPERYLVRAHAGETN